MDNLMPKEKTLPNLLCT